MGDTYTAVVVEYQGVRGTGLTILDVVRRNLDNYEALLLRINRSVQVSRALGSQLKWYFYMHYIN